MGDPPPRALSCVDDPTLARAVEAILTRGGFEIVGRVSSAADALVAAGLAEPRVAVVDLALTGERGLGVVGALRAAAPGCAVILVSPFATMRHVAVAAGAHDVVDGADLRALEHSLRSLVSEDQALGAASASPVVAPDGSLSRKTPSS